MRKGGWEGRKEEEGRKKKRRKGERSQVETIPEELCGGGGGSKGSGWEMNSIIWEERRCGANRTGRIPL